MLLRHKIVVKLNKRRLEPNNRGKNKINYYFPAEI